MFATPLQKCGCGRCERRCGVKALPVLLMMAEKARTAVIQEAYIQGISTRSVTAGSARDRRPGKAFLDRPI
jgi:hypothetical protein